ncbi:NAC domain-containing protein 90 [Brachypodium distachyon]|uniref:NAC domain-containing protein n=1 Tax=Brachypodium distachyon TaxID=15368 RepID=I1HIZ6_BRADI|nr:NAC domain-containing protein 90 [Brachypodium distachyon]KQK06026.1 hypothetical protein BRADI_2g23967v3 [Brachypodium distachyon]|eukprot:XP_003568356.1 NAC domain-containing protein 90 [Brachypodium distachyon]
MGELPPGYRFYPTEEELVRFYLRHKLDGGHRARDIERVIPVADVCSLDPWQLPEAHRGVGGGEPWFYFCARQDREARGGRPSRTTPSGYWKAAGTPGLVYSVQLNGHPIGTKKTMVFYTGRAPAGTKTKWKMNEYRALDHDVGAAAAAPAAPNPFALHPRSEFTLCRLYTKSGCPRQFDRRPCTGAAAGSSAEDPMSSSFAALGNEEDEVGRGQKRKRQAAPNDGASSSSAACFMQQRQTHGGADEEEELADYMIDWAEFLDWI